jgi:protein SCO1/2
VLFFFLAVVLVPTAAFAIFSWYQDRIEPLPYFGAGYTIESGDDHHFSVPMFAFINQDGDSLNDTFVKGKIWVAHYFFIACPSICPKMMADMQTVQSAFKGDDNVKIISLTVNPEEDTPKQLKEYALKRKIDLRKWQLGTGNKRDLYRFARNGLFITATDGDGGPNDFIHSDKFVLIDRNDHIRGYYDGTSPAEVAQLIKDIRRLE